MTPIIRFTPALFVSAAMLLLPLSIPTARLAQGEIVWEPTNGPFGGIIQALVENDAGDLFAGTDGGGVFRSTNNGDAWTAANSGLTNLQVRALAPMAASSAPPIVDANGE